MLQILLLQQNHKTQENRKEQKVEESEESKELKHINLLKNYLLKGPFRFTKQTNNNTRFGCCQSAWE